jgi:hypothetical protein
MHYTHIISCVVLVTAAASCAPDDRKFTVDEKSFTPSERDEIARAAEKWGEVLEEPIDVNGGSWTIRRGPVPANLVAWTDDASRSVTIGWRVRDDEIYAVALHELGHSVGFVHHTEAGVMNARYGATEFTVADVTECAHLHRCKAKLQAHVDVDAAP